MYNNIEKFNTINDETCYWAGFIAADGCLSHNLLNRGKTLKFTLSNKDLILLNDFVNFLEISLDKIKVKEKYCSLNISIGSVGFEIFEKNFNIVPKKSLILNPPNLYNPNEILSFIKGYIDGDGCLNIDRKYPRINLTGTYNMLSWVSNNFYSILGVNNNNPTKSKNVYQIAWKGKPAYIIYQKMNSINKLGLKRKWTKFDLLEV
jgi:hypothetical protein